MPNKRKNTKVPLISTKRAKGGKDYSGFLSHCFLSQPYTQSDVDAQNSKKLFLMVGLADADILLGYIIPFSILTDELVSK